MVKVIFRDKGCPARARRQIDQLDDDPVMLFLEKAIVHGLQCGLPVEVG